MNGGVSHIKRAIISRLKNADTLRYSQLYNPATDRDLFNYHLRQLVTEGLIDKLPNSAGYTLSEKGQRRVADVHSTSDQADRLFKINVLLIVTEQRPDGLYILNQRRTAQPSYGIVGVPGGTIIKAEPLLVGAARKLREETGIDADFEYLCTTRRILYKNNSLFADVLFPICIANNHEGEPQITEYGENFWVPIDQAIENDSRHDEHIEQLATVLKALQADNIDNVRGSYNEQVSKL